MLRSSSFSPARPRRFDRYTSADALAVVLYLGLPLALVFLPVDRLAWLTRDPLLGSYLLNLVLYAAVFVAAIVAARRYVVRDARILATRPLFTLGILPLLLVAMLIVTAIVVALSGGVQISVNQSGLEDMTAHVPWWLTAPLLVLVGPFVEEYIFRHLMIGKLSQYLNRWACYAASVVLFASLHIAGREAITVQALAPYLGLGFVLVFAYAWTANNLMFSYSLHALKNLLSVVLMYTVDISSLTS
ncbi:CPBP family intramembrane glutamic endopeptidase [Sinomonas notoginsengisoli]|uniref:CPBP family intramembrane glutamic endopeptidase n=1 Tax=Sinomonas notoginsengisoli TaxID=1457311 RepID=UPI001F250519|nr:type II CAAX endopeptidase family protein [Sinomonas notoginsengisoli]